MTEILSSSMGSPPGRGNIPLSLDQGLAPQKRKDCAEARLAYYYLFVGAPGGAQSQGIASAKPPQRSLNR